MMAVKKQFETGSSKYKDIIITWIGDFNPKMLRIAENIGQVPWFENVNGCGDTRSAEVISDCVVEGWRNSPGHYANMIGDFEELGVGVAFTKDSIAYFTQVFRTP